MRSEAAYQAKLVKRLRELFPTCHITYSDPSQNQGIPDILILFGNQWAMLEVKRSANAPFQANQEYYLDKFNGWSFARVIYPENEAEVLNELSSAFGSYREARVS